MSDFDEAACRARAEKATEGPWEVGDWWHIQGAAMCQCHRHGELVWQGRRDINGKQMHAHIHRRHRPIGGDVMQADATSGVPLPVIVGNDWGDATTPADAEFIAHARTDVPALLALLDKARALGDRHQLETEQQRERAERAEAELAEARGAIERVKALADANDARLSKSGAASYTGIGSAAIRAALAPALALAPTPPDENPGGGQ